MTGLHKWAVGILMCILSGCSPHSSEEFQREGEQLCRSLVAMLQGVETSDQLVALEPQLKKKFESLVALMIEAERFQEAHAEDWDSGSSQEPPLMSALLKQQLHRVYLMEGGREIIERTQHESLVKLDAYERARLKQRAKLKTQ